MEVYLLIRMHGGLIEDVLVFKHQRPRDEAYIALVEEHYGSEDNYLDLLEHGIPDDEFHTLDREIEPHEDYTPDVPDIEFEEEDNAG